MSASANSDTHSTTDNDNDLGIGVSARTRKSPPNSLNVPQSGKADMTNEANRIKSFSGKWNKFQVKAVDLAKAGFHYIGPNDRVICAFCNGRVYNWIPGDSPFGEHTRLFPNCQFIQKLNKEHLSKLQTAEAKVLASMGYSEANIQLAFKEWKVREGVSVPQIAQLLDVIYASEDKLRKKREAITSSPLAKTTFGTTGEPDEVLHIQRENEELKASNTCKICFEAEVKCVFLPCSHLVCCMECADRVNICPLCRQRIFGSVKAYRA